MKYFAYGSNMDPVIIERICDQIEVLGRAKLHDYRLGFTRRSTKRNSGVADIIAAPRNVLWGVLYEIDDHCFLLWVVGSIDPSLGK